MIKKPCNTCYKGKWLMNEQLTLAHQKQDIVGRSVKTKLQKCTLQIYKWAILSGEEFMVLEKLVGEKFMIPCKNIHPCICVQNPEQNYMRCHIITFFPNHTQFVNPPKLKLSCYVEDRDLTDLV